MTATTAFFAAALPLYVMSIISLALRAAWYEVPDRLRRTRWWLDLGARALAVLTIPVFVCVFLLALGAK